MDLTDLSNHPWETLMQNVYLTLILFSFSACYVNPNQSTRLTQSNNYIPTHGYSGSYEYFDETNHEDFEIFVGEDTILYPDTNTLPEEIEETQKDIYMTDRIDPLMCGICVQGQTPIEESCNGLDDDCDCEIDENWADKLGTPCRGYYLEGEIFLDGYCTDLGEIICNSIPGHGYMYLQCSTADPTSAFTTPAYWDKKDGCDNLDADCDGEIDEDCVE